MSVGLPQRTLQVILYIDEHAIDALWRGLYHLPALLQLQGYLQEGALLPNNLE